MTDEIKAAAGNDAEPFSPLETTQYRAPVRVEDGDQVPASSEARAAHSLEHIARRMDSLDKKLERLVAAVERLAAKS